MIILLGFAFLAGIVTVLSPCILPVLPIVLSGSIGGKHRPWGVITGFVLSFTVSTVFVSTIVRFIPLPANALRVSSIAIITGAGLILLVPWIATLWERYTSIFARFSPKGQSTGFWGGFAIGLSLGLVWTPCVGPILAAVISLSLTGTVSSAALFITLAYAVGTAIPMFAIALGGRQLLQRVPWLEPSGGAVQRGLGLVMVVIGVALFFNLDRKFQTWVLQAFPQYGAGLTKLEDNSLVRSQLKTVNSSPKPDDMGKPSYLLTDEAQYPLAPELSGGTAWINSAPLKIHDELKGKVVLVDFWTYTCINCIRTLPYLKQWYRDYKDKGLVIIGVHSPEFEFEKDHANVVKAVADDGITYPVVQDNEFAIWQAYQNQYWPAHYLIDKNGRVRYTQAGEGGYEETENEIRSLLGEEPMHTGLKLPFSATRQQTAETYLGYKRAQSYTEGNGIQTDTTKNYDFTYALPEDTVGLKGSWNVSSESILAASTGAQLSLNFQAQQVYLVLAPPDGGQTGTVHVLLDGQPLPKKYWTKDMNTAGELIIKDARKYDVLDLGADYGRHTVTLQFSKGVRAFAFTFGA